METTFEKNKLYAFLGERLVDLFKGYKAIVAGGTLTSLFSNRDINDIDLYFRNEEDAIGFVSQIMNDGAWVVSNTKKATQLMYNDVNVQVIHFQFFKSPEDIFNTFDFTSCMAAYDFSIEQFTLHPDFLKHNSQRILKFNKDTSFPIVSLLRVQKYEGKGYSISKPEFIRIILACMALEIDTYEDLKEQLGGMYGINYDKLFEDVKEEEFNLQTAIDKIANITLSEDYFTKPSPLEKVDKDEILDTISKKPVRVLEVNGKLYKIGHDKLLQGIKKKPEYYVNLDTVEFFKRNKFYKFVNKVNDKYFSFHDKEFEYILEEIVVANTSKKTFGSGDYAGKLHMSEKYDLDGGFGSRSGAVLIELEVVPEDFINVEYGHLTAKKAKMTREVPKEEWRKWDDPSGNYPDWD
jgi:hypothetical protein